MTGEDGGVNARSPGGLPLVSMSGTILVRMNSHSIAIDSYAAVGSRGLIHVWAAGSGCRHEQFSERRKLVMAHHSSFSGFHCHTPVHLNLLVFSGLVVLSWFYGCSLFFKKLGVSSLYVSKIGRRNRCVTVGARGSRVYPFDYDANNAKVAKA